ncbi:hypothetical protein [Varibaculum cambriense]|uniref:hypothetical protein n=1 Tax=Varibaculum cambriense TaxID=184870 RepID=UPI002912743E|nr:hypothetical protein [Varibaculum cambriense]MDU3274124.1 hypothetical protein [Varibaculum cambriense]
MYRLNGKIVGRYWQGKKPFRHLLWQAGLATAVIAGVVGTSGAVALHTSSLPAGQPVPEATAQAISATNPAVQAGGDLGLQVVNAKVTPEMATAETTKAGASTSLAAAAGAASSTAPAAAAGAASSTGQYSLAALQRAGVVNWSGYKFTYYSQQVLPGGGLRIPGRHVNAGGYVADADGYIVLANDAPKGTVINTPFGAPGKVYDRGTRGNHFDVYTR